jgi:hypothetical protein
VAGLWWHDRKAIRKAHAYGLSRIFAQSTLSVRETRVMQLAAGVAVVHARVRLEGQTPVAGDSSLLRASRRSWTVCAFSSGRSSESEA